MAASKTPPGLAAAGRRLWTSIAGQFELAEYEKSILLQAARCADLLDRLNNEVVKGGLTTTNHRGDEVAAPCLIESRQQAVVLSRLVSTLRVPDASDVRPQRRGASRSPYQFRVVND